ncbi:hypothetical protein COV93_04385 [Candidatus Woesearchaeota archaeon CG11_big_fil_rev_8_21_14_0_20_43_8]|nr:MAG: hypothetical protein COV93_04385 [Candidatus Woesearchaeota archaeon CG11_big_fil_rev_8_21_14_0_20_43_8]
MAKSRRKVIFAWAQREYRNLMKVREMIRVPSPITFVGNVLVMEMIGKNKPAPKLKDADIPDPLKMFNKIKDRIKKLYQGGFIHGDLSEFNILVSEDEPIFIDFSQCSPKETNRAVEFLKRDITNLCRFFAKYGVDFDPEDIFRDISDSKA